MSDEFHRQQLAETTQQLTRDNAAPQVGVHTMSEYIFCRRAGQLAMEKSDDDLGADFTPAPALGGIQWYEPDLIAAELERHADALKKIGVLFAVATALTACVAFYDRALGAMLAGCGVLGVMTTGRLWWWHEVLCYFRCRRRLQQANKAATREPNWEFPSPQPVNWWQLLQAGFDSRKPEQSLHNPMINLKGRPWRILHRGDRHIPVIRIRVAEFDGTNLTAVRLYEKHRARIAAYAHLVETCEQGQADWAIILYNNSDDGIAVPLGDRDWNAFRNGMQMTRREVSQLQDDPRYQAEAPKGRRKCAGCPFGRPRRVGLEPTVLSGTVLAPFATSDSRGERLFHSTCGDRFQDVPPHRDAEELGLLK